MLFRSFGGSSDDGVGGTEKQAGLMGSISKTPEGLNGEPRFENSQAPSGLRVAIRMPAPGVWAVID